MMSCMPNWKRLLCDWQSLTTIDLWTLLSDAFTMVLIVALAALGTLAYGLC
jgi:hypothetical protein